MIVTPKDYERELARDVEPEFAFKPGKHRFVRGGFLKRHNLSPEQVRDMAQPENVRAAISINPRTIGRALHKKVAFGHCSGGL